MPSAAIHRPNKHRGSLYRAWAHSVAAPFGFWLSRHIAWKIDPFLLRLTRGVEDETERARLWDLGDRVFPPFATYRESAARSGRAIPILRLTATNEGE